MLRENSVQEIEQKIVKPKNPMKMNAIVEIMPNRYGFGTDWTLVIEHEGQTKRFWLGQDAKVCQRIIGGSPEDVIAEIGSNDLSQKQTREKLAELILDSVGFEPGKENELLNLQPWELAAE